MANPLPFNMDDSVVLSRNSREAQRKHFGLKAEPVTRPAKRDYTWLMLVPAMVTGFAIGYMLL